MTNNSIDGTEVSVDVNKIVSNADQLASQQAKNEATIEQVINEAIRDTSPEAKAGRLKRSIRAAYGEFMCSLLFYTPIFCTLAHGDLTGGVPSATGFAVAFVGGFQAIAISFAFSSISGAHFNSAISFALWLTGKLSNRKFLMYFFCQMAASLCGMVIATIVFSGNLTNVYDSIAINPPSDINLGKVFATEFIFTFFLTYTAFTVAFEEAESQKKDTMSFKTISDSEGLTLYASTPQSKTGFAPFAIGLTIFSLSLMGGTGGAAFNPGRLFGPAVISGKGWNTFFLYWLGEFSGAAAAGLTVTNLHRFGISTTTKAEITATQAYESVLGKKNQPPMSVNLPMMKSESSFRSEGSTNPLQQI